MISTKASAMAQWARERGVPATRFDYCGHGQSEGAFEDGTITKWLAEARAVFEQVAHGPRVLVGSSLGGYIALLLLRAALWLKTLRMPRASVRSCSSRRRGT